MPSNPLASLAPPSPPIDASFIAAEPAPFPQDAFARMRPRSTEVVSATGRDGVFGKSIVSLKGHLEARGVGFARRWVPKQLVCPQPCGDIALFLVDSGVPNSGTLSRIATLLDTRRRELSPSARAGVDAAQVHDLRTRTMVYFAR